jgi:hypothetical protein
VTARWLTGPTFLAAVVTLANAAKPVVVDDAAYLAFARQIAARPFDPYGFELYWYTAPEPAMGVLCPPVVPYWLGLGVAVVGDSPPLLKLWMFPFVWLFAWSLRDLLRRFARGTERAALPLLMLSPAVLPTVNLMLDIPAVGLGLAALALFARACDRGSWRLAAAAGLAAGLAMQTKYTALLAPAALGWYGLTHRRAGLTALAGAVAAALFAGWELLIAAKYGVSHFLFHLAGQRSAGGPIAWLGVKWGLLPGLLGGSGLLAVGVGLYAGRAVGLPGRVLVWAAVLWTVGAAAVCLLPADRAVFRGGFKSDRGTPLASVVWRTAGAAALATAAGCAAVLLVRRCKPFAVRRSRDSWFVVGWVLLELAGYFALTPFPAARRVIGPTIALGVLAARVVSRVSRARPGRRPPGWVVPFGVAAGVLTAALDIWDAYPEKVLAEQAAEVVRDRPPGSRVWYAGHWGFQYYCERAGMRPAFPGLAVAAGDYLVLPLHPDPDGFYRPDSANAWLLPPADAEWVAELEWDDRLAAATIPSFYGGPNPVVGRDHPRLRVGVFRLTRAWVAGE